MSVCAHEKAIVSCAWAMLSNEKAIRVGANERTARRKVFFEWRLVSGWRLF